MDIRLLGPVEIHAAEGDVVLTASRTRALLAILALRAGTTVSRDELIDAVWGDDPPPTAPTLVQIQISNLRRALDEAGEPDRIATRSAGYQLSVGPESSTSSAPRRSSRRRTCRSSGPRPTAMRTPPYGYGAARRSRTADGVLGRRERDRLAGVRREPLETRPRCRGGPARLLRLPGEHWSKLRSTNPLERVNREIGRRTDVVAIFPKRRRADRSRRRDADRTDDEWLLSRRYLPRIALGHPGPRRSHTHTKEIKEVPALSAT